MKANYTQNYRLIGLNDKIIFGKYKGQRLRSIIENDVNYMIYLASLPNVEMSKEVKDHIRNYQHLSQ